MGIPPLRRLHGQALRVRGRDREGHGHLLVRDRGRVNAAIAAYYYFTRPEDDDRSTPATRRSPPLRLALVDQAWLVLFLARQRRAALLLGAASRAGPAARSCSTRAVSCRCPGRTPRRSSPTPPRGRRVTWPGCRSARSRRPLKRLPGSRASRRPCPNAGSPPRRCSRSSTRPAPPRRLGDRRPALLRLRDRRVAARDARGHCARRGVGPERRAARHLAGGRRARGRGDRVARRRARPAGRDRRRLRHLRHDRQPERARAPRATRSSRARAGTSKRRACSARRRYVSWSATRCTSACSRRSAILGPRPRARRARAGRRTGTHARGRAARARRAGPIVCLQAGNVNTGALRPGERRRRARARCRRVGPRRRRLRAVGARRAVARAARRRAGRRRLLGHRRPQVAQRAVRQRPRLRAATPHALRAAHARSDGRLPHRGRAPRARPVRPRVLAPRPRHRGVGGALSLGREGLARPARAHLRATRGASRRGLQADGLRDPERRRAEPGAGLVRRARAHAPRDRRSAARRRPAGAAARSGRAARPCASA